jgi:cell division protease FtsH
LNNIAKSIAIWLVVALVLMTVFNQFSGQSKADNQVKYSQFMQEVKDGRVASVQIDGRIVHGKTQDGKEFST